jgi:hypothetical protein
VNVADEICSGCRVVVSSDRNREYPVAATRPRARSPHSCSVSKISSLLAPSLKHRVQLIKLILLKRPVQELFVRIVTAGSIPSRPVVEFTSPGGPSKSLTRNGVTGATRRERTCTCVSAGAVAPLAGLW